MTRSSLHTFYFTPNPTFWQGDPQRLPPPASSWLRHLVDVHGDAGYVWPGQHLPGAQDFQPKRHAILVYVYVDVVADRDRVSHFAWAKSHIDSVDLEIVINLHISDVFYFYPKPGILARRPSTPALYHRDLCFCQPVQPIDDLVNQPVGGG